MIPATAVHAPSGFFATGGGYEYPALLGVSAAALTLMGPGDWSLDAQPDHLPLQPAVDGGGRHHRVLHGLPRNRATTPPRACRPGAEASSHALQGVPTGAEKHFGELHVADHRGGSDRVEQSRDAPVRAR